MLLHGEGALLPDGMAAALPAALPPLAFTAATEPEGSVLRLPASELRAWLPAWAATKEDCASRGGVCWEQSRFVLELHDSHSSLATF